MRKAWLIGWIVVVALVVVLLFNWLSGETDAKAENKSSAEAPVEVAQVEHGMIPDEANVQWNARFPVKICCRGRK